ncbi:MAG TPA: queuosine precursor transporter [Acidobacteriota bacterium]|nr:queuosine precursor transporter [Acidobacteriota bacterium]
MNIEQVKLRERRERVFLVFAGLFLGSLAMLNIIGISRFVDLSFEVFGIRIPFLLAVGVLPYPITFLCTDFISELFGRRRANFMVWVGLLLNLWVMFILWLGGVLPGYETLDPQTGEIVRDSAGRLPVFYEIRGLAFGAVAASMIAYLAAQFCDVYLFHFWKDLTGGKHLWLRNNGSTLVSQFIDTFAVITITHFYAAALPVDPEAPIWPQLWVFIGSGYVFKLVSALLDTIPFYVGVRWLSRYLQVPLAHAEDESGRDAGS